MAALVELPTLAVRLSAALDEAGIRHAISGAVAMAAHSYVRATQDLHVLVVTSALQLPRVFAIVRAEGFEGEDRDLIEALRERYVAALHAGAVTVEILVPVLPYHRELVARSVRLELPGGSIPVVSVEDLIVLKMLWHRAKDVPDVHALIATASDLDRLYIRRTLQRILPRGDPRRAEIQDLFGRFGWRTVPEQEPTHGARRGTVLVPDPRFRR
ncbi:MAG: nucleotidyl transferase AbiEii/AbiGii toxin family protein [Planctomycetota bacterium]